MRNVNKFIPVLALVVSSLALIGCGQQTQNLASSDASGNFVTSTTGYSPVVMVVLPGSSGICTGTFVSEKAVLTAAHCTLTSGRYQVVSSFGTFSTYTVENLGPGVVNDPNDVSFLIFSTNVASRALGQVYDILDSSSVGDTVHLVGFGCNNLNTRRGAGTKRAGTNRIGAINDYMEFYTSASDQGIRGILGSDNQAGSCFGDSGGPALKEVNGQYYVVGVTHAGGTLGGTIISQYVDVSNRSDNRNFIANVNTAYNLNIASF